jgi:N-methylhydantoinase A
VIYNYGRSERLSVPADAEHVRDSFATLVERAKASLRNAGFEDRQIKIIRSVDMRYRQQVHELNVSFSPGTGPLSEQNLEDIYQRFDELYELTYGPGAGYREAGKEIMAFRVVAIGELSKPKLKKHPIKANQTAAALKPERKVYFQEEKDFIATKIYDYDRLASGSEIFGPAIIETPITTIVVNPQDRAIIDDYRNVRMYIGD